MTLYDHAAAISAALAAAAADGCYLEDSNCEPPLMDLNRYDGSQHWRLVEWAQIDAPEAG